MPVVSQLRFPIAVALGLLLTSSLFFVLLSLTRVTFDLQTVETVKIEFTRIKEETPEVRKSYAPVPEREIPLLEPRIGPPIADDIGPPITTITRDIGEPVVPMSGPTVAPNRDMIPLVRIPPEYPPAAAQRGIEGWVVVQFNISETGSVMDAMVVDNEPSAIFDNAALRAIERWRYNPRVENNEPVEVRGVQVRLTFDLNDE